LIAKLSILLIFVPVLTWITGCKQLKSPDLPPNIMFVLIDDLRPELGCYGIKEIKTPHIDKFASQGVMFTRNFCQVSLCAPSRACMLTGLRNDSLRVWDNKDRFRRINPDVITIPQYFHEHGYHTVSMGKIFHNHMPDSVSFDEPDLRPEKYKTDELIGRDPESFYYSEALKRELAKVREQRLKRSPGSYGWNYGRSIECAEAFDTALYDGAQTELAIERLKNLKDLQKPFFLALGYYRPHLPFVAPRKYWDLYDRDKLPLAGNPFLPEYSPVMAINSASELNLYYDLERIRHPSESIVPEETAGMLKHGYYACVAI
jgi:arylsulfatase A-like enzyme